MGRRLLAPVTSLAKSVFSKIAQTAIGKTISAITSKIVTQLGLQTALQAIGTTVAPVIGNIIAFVVGLVVDATIGLAVRTFKKLKEYAPMLIGALVGLTTSAFAGFGATGIALSTGIGAITGAGLQSFFTGSGPATGFLTSTVQVIGGLILAFPVMWLWNYVFNKVPSVHLNVFQAWALNILTGILFGKTSSDSSKR